MRTYVPPNLRHPAMAETLPGSVFTPAIAAWSSGGQLGALGLPNWAGYAVAGSFLALAAMRKLSWTVGLAGAAAAWYLLVPPHRTATAITTGTGIVANGTTLQFSVNSPGTLTTVSGASTMQVGGSTYPVLQTEANPDGTTTYYLDNATA